MFGGQVLDGLNTFHGCCDGIPSVGSRAMDLFKEEVRFVSRVCLFDGCCSIKTINDF